MHCALGNADGPMEINVTESTAIASFLSPNVYAREQFGGKSAVKRTEQVEVKRLDSVFSDCIAHIPNPRVFLKMDTQGYDLRVLEGARNCLRRVLAIQSELSVRKIYEGMPDFVEAISALSALGFELSALFPVTIDRNLRVVELDCVVVR
jgi:FkbM family methyltransferase